MDKTETRKNDVTQEQRDKQRREAYFNRLPEKEQLAQKEQARINAIIMDNSMDYCLRNGYVALEEAREIGEGKEYVLRMRAKAKRDAETQRRRDAETQKTRK